MTLILMILGLFALILINVPIAVSLGIVAVVAMIAGRLSSNAALWPPCVRVWRSLGATRSA